MILLLACTGVGTVSFGDAGEGDSVETGSPRADSADSSIEEVPGDTSVDPDDTGEDDEDDPKVFDHLPVLLIDASGRIGDDEKTDGTLEVIEEHDGTLDDLDAAPRAWSGPIGIEVHGSSSEGYPKQGYRFECRGDDGTDTDCALVGLNEGHDYVLVANYSDKSYMRNALAYQLARDVAADRGAYEVASQFVEVFLDSEYLGVYLLTDRVEREAKRLDLPPTTDPETSEVNGGFILKIDQHRSAGFDSARGTPLDWMEPKADEVTRGERAYIQAWVDDMESVLDADDFDDPVDGYAAWIDVDGFIDHFLVNEVTHNIDAYRLSSYVWTDGPPGTSLFHAGPVWDFDRAFGNVNYCDCQYTYGWIIDDLYNCGEGYQFPFWWLRLEEDPLYVDARTERWLELREGVLSDEAILTRIEEFRAQLEEAEPRDQAKWRTMGEYVDPNWYVGETWEDEIDWFSTWTLDRVGWMDRQLRP